MSKELIEKLRYIAVFTYREDVREAVAKAADALEAKAAPVGELSWQPSGADYDHSIHTNPDAKAWADLFVATFPGLADKHELMITWFANAMMAMHDYLKAQQPQSAEAVAEDRHEAVKAIHDVMASVPCASLYSLAEAVFDAGYTPQPSAGVVDDMLEVLSLYAKAGVGNSTDFELQFEARRKADALLAHLNGKEVV